MLSTFCEHILHELRHTCCISMLLQACKKELVDACSPPSANLLRYPTLKDGRDLLGVAETIELPPSSLTARSCSET